MTERSYVWDGQLIGDATIAPYDTSEWARIWRNLTGGARVNYGVLKGTGDGTNEPLTVRATSPASKNVDVLQGAALVHGRLYETDATVTLAIAPNASGNPRIDLVILRADFVLQTVRLAVKQGTPAASPTPPTLQQDTSFWEIPLAAVAAANGFSTITQANISPQALWVNAADGIYLDNVLNNSGGVLDNGDVVIWDYSAARAITTTTTRNDSRVAGVVQERIAAGAYGRVLVRGFGMVNAELVGFPALSRGMILIAQSIAKKATVVGGESSGDGNQAPNILGFWHETSFNGKVLAYIDVEPNRNPFCCTIVDEKSANTNGGNFASGSFVTRTLNTIYNAPLTLAADSGNNAFVSLSSNQFTLQPGVYEIEASAPAYRCDAHTIRIVNISGGTVVVATGTSEYSPSAADTAQTRSIAKVTLRVESVRAFEIQHRCGTTRNTDGLGKAANLGQVETYTMVRIRRLGNYLP